MRGLERRAKAGQDINTLNSVASFFVSRVDTAADKLIDAKRSGASDADRAKFDGLLGKVAVANAKIAASRSTRSPCKLQTVAVASFTTSFAETPRP